jgi:hypothetical protein
MNILQIKITLLKSKPPIWRVIEIAESASFGDLHMAIQGAMGWSDDHLHGFVIGTRNAEVARIGMRYDYDDNDDEDDNYDDDYDDNEDDDDDEYDDPEELDEGDEILSEYAGYFNKKLTIYEYDYGDGWKHSVELVKKIPAEEGVTYPRCISGKMACPPEDIGGIHAYYFFLEAFKDKNHKDYEIAEDFLGENFDPGHFDITKVNMGRVFKGRRINSYGKYDYYSEE